LRDGEVLSTDRQEFGRSLREFPYLPGWKEVLCPYWQRTDHGTVKCLFTGAEVFDDTLDADHAVALSTGRLGKAKASELRWHWALPDEVKICAVNEDQDDPWAYDT
jgi:hypothetical protein